MTSKEQVITMGCRSHCGGSCVLKVYVREGVIVHIETDDQDEPQLRACPMCRSYRQRIYSPDRLLYPLKRVGERGEGKFERISWDEALETIAREYRRIAEAYGPASVLYLGAGGDLSFLHNSRTVQRAFNMAGGCTVSWGNPSREGEVYAMLATYGLTEAGHSADDLVNSKLVILWGMNPTTHHRSGTALAMFRAKEAGARFIAVDPRLTDTAGVLADRWIPLRPGTDVAVMLAMAYMIITEELQDQKFLDTYTVGFDQFKAYVLGNEDGVAKTPRWAEAISGIPAQTIAKLAREYATIKPAALLASWGPGRSAMGEQFHRAAYVLAAMTGNIGMHGGGAGGLPPPGLTGNPARLLGTGLPLGDNPVEADSPLRSDAIIPPEGYGGGAGGRASVAARLTVKVNHSLIWDAILKGRAGGYASDYKMLYMMGNRITQYPNLNKAIQALKSVEFIANEEHFMTPTAKFADIVLPTATFFERNDATQGAGPHVSFMKKVIDPLGECRSHLEIGIGLAQKLGIVNYNDKTEEEWLKALVGPVVPDYEQFKEAGVHKFKRPEPYVAFKEQIQDPKNNPFPTPSAKIEIHSQRLADMNIPMIPAIPKYIEPWESSKDPLAKKYPLQLITSHPKRRMHSQFDNLPWLREIEPQAVMISTADAEARGINNGDLVRVFNQRGEMIIPASVTGRIMPGVVDIPEGAWYDPDEHGIDRGGCANVLTRDQPSAGGAFPANTSLVEVQKA